MPTTPNTRWGRLCQLDDVRPLEPIVTLLGKPELHASEDAAPPYRPGVFQVLMRPDGVWIHSCLLRRWRRRQSHRFIASCDEPSDFRRANPNANTPHWPKFAW